MIENNHFNQPHYCPKTQHFYNTPKTQAMKGGLFGAMAILWQMLLHQKDYMPKSVLPTMQPDWQEFLNDDIYNRLMWFGHSSWMIRIAEKTLLFDPVFAKSVSPLPIFMRRFQSPVIELNQLPNIDYIVYTHNHYDHLDKNVVEYFKSHETRFIVPLKMGKILQDWGISVQRIIELDWWQNVIDGDLTLTAVPARHNTARGHFDKDKTLWCGWVLQNQQETIYYSGDSSYGDGTHFRQIGQYFPKIDLALIENGQYHPVWFDNHLFPEQTAQAVLDVNARCFMPVHWGAYALSTHHWSKPVQTTTSILQQQGIKMLTPLQGQVVYIESETSSWWVDIP